ncbi:MAG TPA: sulfurtransferase [Thermoplasmata archaeon]|nr:sulfurtransferase [Thermoplasmata archaeon]HUJ77889.1 sulfurtransferase [Thermoplasmata archaeon]
MTAAYAHPEVLVETEWLDAHRNDPAVRVVEVDYDPEANYAMGHVPGASLVDWRADMNDPVSRDIVSGPAFGTLLARLGIDAGSTVVLYGDFNNWFAAFAFWVFKYYHFRDLRLLNGGRKKWIAEDRPLTKEAPPARTGSYAAPAPDETLRAYLDTVRTALPDVAARRRGLVDVRGPREFSGEVTAPPEYPNEHAQRGGHIPGAVNVPWAQAVNDDGTFRSAEELDRLYRSKGLDPSRPVITYCRIGERSSHTWFVLRYLLGYPDVRNYDGSWTEWGNQIRLPIAKP